MSSALNRGCGFGTSRARLRREAPNPEVVALGDSLEHWPPMRVLRLFAANLNGRQKAQETQKSGAMMG